jgi:hypothetical protein
VIARADAALAAPVPNPAQFGNVHERRFVEDLITAVPEAFPDRERQLEDPLPYVALGEARIWIEEHALRIKRHPMRATVRPEHADALRRFWDFVETHAATADGDMKTLLQIESFEGVGWVEDVSDYLGPATRALLEDAQAWLSTYNGQVGRWAKDTA